uniref:Uncharacterized protein n=1 Tax=Megaselia scalaris TaxID=36166 RepID=T1GLW5_MEGSC
VAIITEPHFGVDSRIKKDNVPDISDAKKDEEEKELDELRELNKPKSDVSENKTNASSASKIEVLPESSKTYHGGARLAFGQRPEVLPTSTSATTKIVLTTPPLVGNIPEEMLNRGTEPSLSSTEDSSEEETEEETVISEQKESNPNEKEQLSQLELSSNKTEERRSESGLYKNP